MSNHSIIEHRANYHYFKLEEDYVLICSFGKQYPQCKAAILAILEHWMNDKRAKSQDEHIYMTYPEWIDNMYGLFRRNTIIACLDELVQEKLVARRPCVRYGKETFEYMLNIRLVQERLKQLEERDEKNCRPNLNASKFKRQAIQKQTRLNLDGSTRPNLNGIEHEHPSKFKRNVDSLTEILSSTIDSKGEDAFAVAPTPPAEMSSEHDYHFAGTQQQHLVWNCHTWCNANHATCEDYMAAIEAGLHESPTDKMPAVPPNVTPVSHSQSSIPDGYMQGESTDGCSDNCARNGLHRPIDLVGSNPSGAPRNPNGVASAEHLAAKSLAQQGEDDAHPVHYRSRPGAFQPGSGFDDPLHQQNHQGTERHDQDNQSDTQGEDDGQLTPISQTIPGLSPGAAPARHSGQASDGAASTASPRGESRASGGHVPDTGNMPDKPQKGKRNGKAPVEPVPIPQEAVSILDDWDSLFKKPVPRTEKHVQAAVDLVPCHPSREDLDGCKGWLFTTDNPQKPWFRKKGVTLQDVRDNYGAWQSVQPGEPTEDELEPYSIPWFLAQQARRQAQELQA